MRDALRAGAVAALCCVLALGIAVIISITSVPPEILLPIYTVKWRFYTAMVTFAGFFSTAALTGMLIGYSWAFGKTQTRSIPRWSKIFIEYFKGATILSLICLGLNTALQEGFSPHFERQIRKQIALSEEYAASALIARSLYADGDPAGAAKYIARVVDISQHDKDMTALKDDIFASPEVDYIQSNRITEARRDARTEKQTGEIIDEDKNLTLKDLLDKARRRFEAESYYDAHYYATMALRAAGSREAEKNAALQIAENAWENINAQKPSKSEREIYEFFNKKQEGYGAIQQGAFLEAYYIFIELAESHSDDPDVIRYLEIAENNLKKSYFFIDETDNLIFYETNKNSFFKIDGDGKTQVVFFKGMTNVRRDDSSAFYLREFEIAGFERSGGLAYKVRAPYAKLIPVSPEMNEEWTPCVILYAVGRSSPEIRHPPLIEAGSLPFDGDRILLLDMPYEDFALALEACEDIEQMSLPSLYKFWSKAPEYGFSSEICLTAFITRVAKPVLFMILSFWVVIIGWRYRICYGKYFNLLCFAATPFLALLIYGLILILRFILKCTVLYLAHTFGGSSILLTFAALLIIFIITGITLAGQRGD